TSPPSHDASGIPAMSSCLRTLKPARCANPLPSSPARNLDESEFAFFSEVLVSYVGEHLESLERPAHLWQRIIP
ncbi:MAG: hypothetical protein ACRDXB_16405, partial [Actinomycetes bacterium]